MTETVPTPDPTQQPPNPTIAAEERKRPPRVSMSTARQRLRANDIPGYRLYWFKEENVPAALDAYYEFVKPNEVFLNQLTVANDATQSGGTDVGSRVSLVADKTELGGPVRAYLMKIKMEYFQEDQKEIARRNMEIMEAIFGDEAKVVDQDGNVKDAGELTYIDRNRTKALFSRPVRKARNIGKGRLT